MTPLVEQSVAHGQRMSRYWLIRVSAFIITLQMLMTAPAAWAETHLLHAESLQKLSIVIVLCLTALVVWQCRPKCHSAWALHSLVWFCALIHVGIVFLQLDSSAYQKMPEPYPPLLNFAVGCFFVSRGALSARMSAAYAALWVGLALVGMPAIQGWQVAMQFVIHMTAVHVSCSVFVALLGRCIARTVTDIETTSQLATAERIQEAAFRAQRHWDALLHDKVIGALALAGRGQSATIPDGSVELAQIALRELSSSAKLARSDFDRQVSESADLRGLELSLTSTGTRPDDVVTAAITSATNEALTNVARHSGVHRVIVDAQFSANRALVVISDAGCGFNPHDVAAHRGLGVSVIDRLASVGGKATITSRPQQGTQVHLVWKRQPTAPLSGTWPALTFVPTLLMAICTGLIAFACAWQHWWPKYAALNVTVALLMAGAPGLILLYRKNTWVNHIIAGLSLLAVILCAIIAVPDTGPDWRHWYLSVLVAEVFALTLLWSRLWGCLWAGAQMAAAVITEAALGNSAWLPVENTATMFFGVAVVGAFIGHRLDKATATIIENRQKAYDIDVRNIDREQELLEGQRQRSIILSIAGDTLQRLAKGGPLQLDLKVECLAVEADARQLLTAGTRLPSRVRQMVAKAKHRGVAVTLLVEHSWHWQSFQPTLDFALMRAQTGDTITVRGPSPTEPEWSIVVVKGADTAEFLSNFDDPTELPAHDVFVDDATWMASMPVCIPESVTSVSV